MNICSYICRKFQSMNEKVEIEKMEEAAYTLKAISNGTRLCVISILSENEEMNVSQLGEKLHCEQSLLSHHLTDMRAKGILNCRRDGKNCYYSLKNKQIVQIIDCIRTCNCAQWFFLNNTWKHVYIYINQIKTIIMNELIKRNLLKIIGILVGGIGGFAYYYFVGCASGTCPITSNPYISVIYGALMGYLLLDMLKKKENETN